MKTELDALIPCIHDPATVVEILANELQGRRSYNSVRCPTCDGTIPILKMDVHFAAGYSYPHCGNDVVVPDETEAK